HHAAPHVLPTIAKTEKKEPHTVTRTPTWKQFTGNLLPADPPRLAARRRAPDQKHGTPRQGPRSQSGNDTHTLDDRNVSSAPCADGFVQPFDKNQSKARA